jgi:GAF domain-containing protein
MAVRAQDRLDLLGEDPDRFSGVTGAILEPSVDAELQAVAEEAARRLSCPIALAVLVLRRQQLYRGYVGLPPEVEAVRGTDRCVSLCQKVVREKGLVAIEDVRFADVPQLLVDRYGVRAYLGAPVRVAGHILGTLCCIDMKPRRFTDDERATLIGLAARVSARLERLGEPVAAPQRLIDLALGDAFASVRAVAERLGTDVALARVSALELGGAVRMLEEAMTREPDRYAAWVNLPLAHGDLQDTLRGLESEVRQLRAAVGALEKAALSSNGGRVEEVIQAALRLAAPAITSVGGARLTAVVLPPLALDAPRPLVVTTLAALLGAIAGRLAGTSAGLTVTPRADGTHLLLSVQSPALTPAAARSIVDELAELVEGVTIQAAQAADGIVISVPVHPPPLTH